MIFINTTKYIQYITNIIINYILLIVNQKQVVQDGYEFFGKKNLITLFSAPNYCAEFDNSGGVMIIDENLMCSFKIIKATTEEDQKKKLQNEDRITNFI